MTHRDAPLEPDEHVIFESVCCGVRLYRCSPTALVRTVPYTMRPRTPIIWNSEATCQGCGKPLAFEESDVEVE